MDENAQVNVKLLEQNGELADDQTTDISAEDAGKLVVFEKRYRKAREKSGTLTERLKGVIKGWFTKAYCKDVLKKNFPFVRLLRGYKIKEDLPNDVISGITVGIMQIPQGMAYSLLAGLPAICGLYTSLFAPIVYFFLGSSKHISMGTIAVVSLMIGSVLDRSLPTDEKHSVSSTSRSADQNISLFNVTTEPPVVDDDSYSPLDIKKIEIATALSLVSGLILLVMGKIKFGLIANYMSEPMVCGFTSGVAIHVVTSQMRHLLGLKLPRFNGAFKVIKMWVAVFGKIDQTNIATLLTSLVCMVIIYLVKVQINVRFKKYLKIPIPIELIMVILATVTSHFAFFHQNYGVNVLETIPAGIPDPRVPSPSLVSNHIGDAAIVGLVAFTQSVSMVKIIARKNGYTINPNQEMVSYAAGSVLNSIFSGYIPAASVARSMVQEGAGGKTQIAGLFGCIVVLVVIVAIGPLFYSLPKCVLSAVIIVNLRSMFRQFLELKPLWKQSKYDFAIWIVTFSCTVILDADIGIAVGIIFSLLSIAIRTQRVHANAVGQVSSSSVYRPEKDYKNVSTTPGVKVIEFPAPLYFANADIFISKIQKFSSVNPAKLKRKEAVVSVSNKKLTDVEEPKEKPDCTHGLHHIIIDFSGTIFIDVVGVKILRQIFMEYQNVGIQLFLVGVNDRVLEVFESTSFLKEHSDSLFVDMQSAMNAACVADVRL